MYPLSYLSAKTIVRESPIHGRGLFACAEIHKDEIVAVKGGHIVTREVLEKLKPSLGPAEIQVSDDLFVYPTSVEEREGSMLYSNHSCDANLGMSGQITFVAMREIAAGEELTHDWAMTDNDESTADCNCGSPLCRGTITGKDWLRDDVQKKYGSYFSSYLLAKMGKTNLP